MNRRNEAAQSSIEGLWVLLVEDSKTKEKSVPMLAQAGSQQYLLGFKNMSNARRFMQASEVGHAEPRMIVKGNKARFMDLAHEAGVAGVLVDYDPHTNDYANAAELY